MTFQDGRVRTAIIVVTALLTVTLLAVGRGGDTEAAAAVESRDRDGKLKRKTAPGCFSARQAVIYYRTRTHHWQLARGGPLASGLSIRGRSCGYARFAADEWRERALQARASFKRWQRERTLRDFEITPGSNAWLRAVDEAQRPYPGTKWWLLSCSAAEGGHGRWVGYGGASYSTSLRDSDTVGGHLQFRWSTFRGMYRHALDDLRRRGFLVPEHLRDPSDDIAWRSALGQALAGGWARFTGNDGTHWSASFGNGC